MNSDHNPDYAILDKDLPSLVPYELWDDFQDFTNEKLRAVVRANCLRRYIEGLVKLFFEDEILSTGAITKEKWKKVKSLHGRLELIINHYDEEIGQKLLEIKNIGNQGSHYGNDVSQNDLLEGIEVVTSFFESLIIRYFRNNQLGSEPPVLTLLSSLPPIKRVYILENLSNIDKNNLVIVDKLSMAYLKSGLKEKAISYLDMKLSEGVIDIHLHENFKWKINELSKNIPKFDISKNILDTKRIFEKLTQESAIDINDYDEFISIFMSLLSGYSKMSANKLSP